MNHPLLINACAAAVALALATLAPPAVAAASSSPAVAPLRHAAPAPHSVQRIIVKFRPGSAAARDRSLVQGRLSAVAVQGVQSSTKGLLRMRALRRGATGADIVGLSHRLDAYEAEALLQQLRRDPEVLFAQVDGRAHALQLMPNDPALPTHQWHMLDTAGGIHAPSAWSNATGAGAVVAVLDTGSTPHADLKDNLVPGYDFISYFGDGEEGDIAGDGDGRDPDATDPGDWTDKDMTFCGGSESASSWHGTHVAGTVAAVTNNGQGLAGVAWGAKVQPVRVLGHCGGYASDIADAIVWAAGGHIDGVPDNATPADVINLSLGGAGACSERPVYQEAIDAAVARGTTVVVAAGNNASDVANFSPASCNNVIAVGAVGMGGAMAYYSNHGSGVTLAAPGGDSRAGSGVPRGYVWSTGNDGATTIGEDILLGMQGTSMASPHVAGIVALMQSAAVGVGRAALTPAQVRQMLVESVRPFPAGLPAGRMLGAGLADANRAVQLALGNPLPVIPPVTLQDGVVLANLGASPGGSAVYSISVPVGARSLNLRTFGGRGDANLFASFDTVPSETDAQYRSIKPGNGEVIVVPNPAPGTWYLRIGTATEYSGVSLLGLAR